MSASGSGLAGPFTSATSRRLSAAADLVGAFNSDLGNTSSIRPPARARLRARLTYQLPREQPLRLITKDDFSNHCRCAPHAHAAVGSWTRHADTNLVRPGSISGSV